MEGPVKSLMAIMYFKNARDNSHFPGKIIRLCYISRHLILLFEKLLFSQVTNSVKSLTRNSSKNSISNTELKKIKRKKSKFT